MIESWKKLYNGWTSQEQTVIAILLTWIVILAIFILTVLFFPSLWGL